MLRFPETKAMLAQHRRPILQLAVGVALIAPLAGSYAQRGGLVPVSEPGVSPTEAASVEPVVHRPTDPVVTAAWREQVRARQEARVVQSFARQFDVPVDLADRIHDLAREEGVEPRIAFGLVRTESSFRRTVVSYAGAVGYTQLLPSTARWLVPGTDRSDLFDRDTNLRVGFRYLRYLMDYYEGDLRLALTAYNRGPGTVDRELRRGRNPENGYADRVLRDPSA